MLYHDAQEYRDELESAVDYWRGAMPAEVKRLARLATHDLYYGPVYVDEAGEFCSMYDEGAKPFGFAAAVKAISDWTDGIDDIQMGVDFDPETEESFYETVDGSAREIIVALFGRELAKYL